MLDLKRAGVLADLEVASNLGRVDEGQSSILRDLHVPADRGPDIEAGRCTRVAPGDLEIPSELRTELEADPR